MFCLHICMHTACVPGARRSEEASDSLELMVVSHHVGVGTDPGYSARVASAPSTEPSLQPQHHLFACGMRMHTPMRARKSHWAPSLYCSLSCSLETISH